jgi:hypothetical protein
MNYELKTHKYNIWLDTRCLNKADESMAWRQWVGTVERAGPEVRRCYRTVWQGVMTFQRVLQPSLKCWRHPIDDGGDMVPLQRRHLYQPTPRPIPDDSDLCGFKDAGGGQYAFSDAHGGGGGGFRLWIWYCVVLYVDRRFGGTCSSHRQGWKIWCKSDAELIKVRMWGQGR